MSDDCKTKEHYIYRQKNKQMGKHAKYNLCIITDIITDPQKVQKVRDDFQLKSTNKSLF